MTLRALAPSWAAVDRDNIFCFSCQYRHRSGLRFYEGRCEEYSFVNRRLLILVFAALISFATLANAGILTGVHVAPGDPPPFSIEAVSDFAPDGVTMQGMQVTAKVDDGSSETKTWLGTTGNTGRAAGNGWSITQTGNTFFHPWILENKELLNNNAINTRLLTQLEIRAGLL